MHCSRKNEGATFVLINQMRVFLRHDFLCNKGDSVFELTLGE